MIKTKTEKAKPKTNKQFPLVIHGKRFETEEEYLDAIHEFLNGNWTWQKSKSISQYLRIASTILFIFSTTSTLIL